MDDVEVRVYIEGRVQGVGFRHATKRFADSVKVSGWVRNLPDGRVEALFIGLPEDVERAIGFVREGPPGARVDQVDVDLLGPVEDRKLERFEIR